VIAVITPVYRETPGQVCAIIEHLSGFSEFCQIIIAITRADPAFDAIRQQLGDRYRRDTRLEIASTESAGRATQMNAGAVLATADKLLFVHADTRLPAGAGQLVTEALSNFQWGRFDIRLDVEKPVYKTIAWAMNTRSRLTGICTGDQAIFITCKAFRQLGGFPEQALMEDIEFSSAAKRLGPPACISEKATTSARRWQQGGVAKTVVSMWLFRGLYWAGVSPDRLAGWYRQIR